MENDLGCKLVFSRQKISVYYTPKHPNKSVFVSFFHLLSTNTKIINKSQFYLGVNSTYQMRTFDQFREDDMGVKK